MYGLDSLFALLQGVLAVIVLSIIGLGGWTLYYWLVRPEPQSLESFINFCEQNKSVCEYHICKPGDESQGS